MRLNMVSPPVVWRASKRKVLYVTATSRGRKTVYALDQAPDFEYRLIELALAGSKLGRMWEFAKVLRCLLDAEPPSIVVWDALGTYAFFLSFLANCRGIYNAARIRGDYWRETRDALTNTLPLGRRLRYQIDLLTWRAVIRRCDVILPVSDFLGERTRVEIGIASTRCQTLPTFVDEAWFRPVDPPEQETIKQHNGLDGKTLILSLTNFDYWRKVEPLLEFAPVYNQLVAAYPNLLWVVGGRGEYLDRFQCELQKALCHDAPVLMPGWLEARPWMRACDLFLHFTGLDSLANVLMEAGASGKVVVVNPYPGAQEIVVENRTGFLVAPEDHAAVYALVDKLLTSPALRRKIGVAARDHICATFSAEAIAARFRTIMDGLPVR